MAKAKQSNRQESVVVLGKSLDKKNFPVLHKWALENPETLESQLQSLADKWHNGSVGPAMVSLESDLQHQ